MSAGSAVIVLTGTALVLIALLVELEHKVIWETYKKHYHPHKNKFIDGLLKPNKWIYALNVYLLWPLVFALGLFMLFKNS